MCFKVNFLDLAFLRVSIIESSNNKCTAHRIVPLKYLRPGYRHLRLRNLQNLPIDCATLFIYSRLEEEEFIYVDDDVALLNSSNMQNSEVRICEARPV